MTLKSMKLNPVKHPVLTIGVTGGIGSGKSAVTDFFAAKGIDVIDADLAARVVVEPGRPALAAIADHFGPEILTRAGVLDRRQLRDIIFQDDGERRWLEALLHPLIGEQIIQELSQVKASYAILVSPLMIEAGQIKLVDRLLVIDVP
ncbi:MAG: dephospho-CoA kinase, partial [Endozoicomonas sp.]